MMLCHMNLRYLMTGSYGMMLSTEEISFENFKNLLVYQEMFNLFVEFDNCVGISSNQNLVRQLPSGL